VNYLQRVAASAARTTPAAAPPPSPPQLPVPPPGEPLATGALAFEEVEDVRRDARQGNDDAGGSDAARASRAQHRELDPQTQHSGAESSPHTSHAGTPPAPAAATSDQREPHEESSTAPVPPRLPLLRRFGAAPVDRIVAPRGLRASRSAATPPGAPSAPHVPPSTQSSTTPATQHTTPVDAQSQARLDSSAAPPEAATPAALPRESEVSPPARTDVSAETAPPLAHDLRPAEVPQPVLPAPAPGAGASPAHTAPTASHAETLTPPFARDASPIAVASASDPVPRVPAPIPIPAVQQREPERPALSIGRVEVVVENELPAPAPAPVYAQSAPARSARAAASPVLERFRLRA